MSSGRLAAKALLLAMFAFGTGCADTGADDAAETGSDTSVDDALSEAAAKGDSFDNAGSDEVAGDLPTAALESPEGEPSVAYLSRRGPHPTASYSISGGGKSYGGGTVYYPSDNSTGLGGVVMCPGYTAKKSSIANWGPFFASHGIVLYTIDTKTTGDQVVQRGPEIMEALRDLQKEGQSGKLRGRMGDKWGVSGWSMGGGGTWIAAARLGPQGVKTAVTLAGHNATAGGAGGVSAGKIQVPTLMMNGSTDTTILGGMGQSANAYAAIPNSTPKLHWETGSCGHFCWGTPTTGNNVSGVLMMAWQKTFLEGDSRFKALLTRETVQRGQTTTFKTNVN